MSHGSIEKSLFPGQNWRYEIEDQVRLSDAFIVCLTKESAKKESFYQKEIKVAFDAADEKPDGTIFIIPVRLEPLEATDLPRRLRDTHWANLFEPDGYDRLVEALRQRAQEIKVAPPIIYDGPSIPWPPAGFLQTVGERDRTRYVIFALWRWFIRHMAITLLLIAAIIVAVTAEFYSLYAERAGQKNKSILLNQEAINRWRVFDLANAYELFGTSCCGRRR